MLQTTVQHKQISNVANQIQIKDRKNYEFKRENYAYASEAC